MEVQPVQYGSLKRFVEKRGGMRVSTHPRIRDRIVEIAIEEFPVDADPVHVEDVLQARVRRRVRQTYGSIMAAILISVLVNIITKLIVEWWFSRTAHRVLMHGWHKNAVEATIVSPPPPPAG
jgi:hypothetical protein